MFFGTAKCPSPPRPSHDDCSPPDQQCLMSQAEGSGRPARPAPPPAAGAPGRARPSGAGRADGREAERSRRPGAHVERSRARARAARAAAALPGPPRGRGELPRWGWGRPAEQWRRRPGSATSHAGPGGGERGRPPAAAALRAVPGGGERLQPGRAQPRALPRAPRDPVRVLGCAARARRGDVVSPGPRGCELAPRLPKSLERRPPVRECRRVPARAPESA